MRQLLFSWVRKLENQARFVLPFVDYDHSHDRC